MCEDSIKSVNCAVNFLIYFIISVTTGASGVTKHRGRTQSQTTDAELRQCSDLIIKTGGAQANKMVRLAGLKTRKQSYSGKDIQ